MKRVLSFGGGLQTTALAIMVAQGELEVDEVVFADTGAEKPETYWYMENYIKPMLAESGLSLSVVRRDTPYYEHGDLYKFQMKIADIPSPKFRRCTDHFKLRAIKPYTGTDVVMVIGFSLDEAYRSRRRKDIFKHYVYPLIEKSMTAQDCHHLILNYGLPVPLKSSCFFCPFQPVVEWNWLKNNHPDLFQKALDLEERYHKRKPEMRDNFGLLRGTPLWRLKDGIQPEMFQSGENSCWSGHCGH